MRLSWFGDFFRALDEVAVAIYRFGDPNGTGKGYWGVIIMALWGIFLIGLPFAVARRFYGQREWVSATAGVVGATSVMWWLHGVLPSAWIYFVDSNKEILQDRVIPSSMGLTLFGRRLDIASNLYGVIRESVVVVMMLVGIAATIWGAIIIQKKFPRGLAPGEERPEAGGYH